MLKLNYKKQIMNKKRKDYYPSEMDMVNVHEVITSAKVAFSVSQDGGKQGEVFASSGFYIPNSTRVHYLDDDANGNIRLYYLNSNSEKVIVDFRIGTIDYEAGLIVVRNLTITALEDPTFNWQVKPESYDVVSALNQIVQIDPSLLTVTAIADNTANGDLGAGYNYTFNSIRS
jgi:hypothetical protein